MTETALERLNRLQMADLGTARREHISNPDRTLQHARLEVIEATRRSNIPGSTEQHIADAHKSRLDGWANLHHEIGDTGEEQLDTLLNGQSHRLQLNDAVRAGGGRNNGYRELQGPLARPVSAAGGKPCHSKSKQHPNRAVSNPQPGPNLPHTRKALNPALNDVWTKDPKFQGQTGRYGSSAHTAPLLRTRRPPLNDFARIISTPENFLAVARSLVPTHKTANKASTEKPKSQDPAKALSHPIDRVYLVPRTLQKPVPSKSPKAGQRPSQDVSPQRSTSLTPADKVVTPDVDLSSDSMSVDSSEEEKPQAVSTDTRDQVKEEEKQDIEPQESSAVEEDLIPVSSPSIVDGILVDLNFVTPQNPEAGVGMSPALEELKGLEFTQFLEPQDSCSPGLANANRKLDFGEASHEQKPNVWNDRELIDEELAEEYQREIDMICELLDRTTLSETFISKLTECRNELKFRLQLPRTPKRDIGRSQQLSAPPAPTTEALVTESLVTESPATEAPAAQGPVIKVPEIVETATTPGTPKASCRVSNPQTSTPPSQSRLNAAALPFSPNAFTQYRSLSNATSTDSLTIFQPTPSKTPSPSQSGDEEKNSTPPQATVDKPSPQPTVAAIATGSTVALPRSPQDTHIFGDHILPGARTRKAGGTHLFGDHLLPGRRAVQPSIARSIVSSSAVSVLTSAPKPSPAAFSLPPQQPKFVNRSSISSNLRPANGSSLTLNVPQSGPVKKALSPLPTNAPTPNIAAKDTRKSAPATTSMQESIYAPQPKQETAPSSGTQRKPSLGQGLMGSRYADPKWL
ncbi:hypothetical protein BDW59DRAFT_156876 [Aspergillus cavernicola]|uniref:Uncharacterized protein n=1 Tax=Aspergillus cavernicola TaxID=176166 RepID=A0ABR4J031_9EURO